MKENPIDIISNKGYEMQKILTSNYVYDKSHLRNK